MPDTARDMESRASVSTASKVTTNVNALLSTLMLTLKKMDVPNIRLGKARVWRSGWKTGGYAVHSFLRGDFAGHVVFGADVQTATETSRRYMAKRSSVTESEVRLVLQMLANDALVAAGDVMARLNIRCSFSAPQVYNRYEWSRSAHIQTPMIEIPLVTQYGIFQLAFTISTPA